MRSVHDVSRFELDSPSGLPRFNMPLELGADLGPRLKGPAAQRRRRIQMSDAEARRHNNLVRHLRHEIDDLILEPIDSKGGGACPS